MADLNDYVYFAEVVAHGGFASAARALDQPKSKLSRRIAGLEKRLGVRLIERTTRRFRVTEVGQAFYERCRAVMLEADLAEATAAEAQVAPRGRVRFSCPTGMVEVTAPSVSAFLARYPQVRLDLLATDRAVDLIGERIDVALRVRSSLATTDVALTARSLGRSPRILVAGPALAAMAETDIASLANLPTLSTNDDSIDVTWHLQGPDGATHEVTHQPRMRCSDFSAVRLAAMANVGVALLPDHVCHEALAAGTLVRLFPDWHGREGIVHLVFTARRGLPPAVRAFIDHLAATFPPEALTV